MKRIKLFSKIFLALFFLTSCKTTLKDANPLINSERNINENKNLEKEKIEMNILYLLKLHFFPLLVSNF